MKYITPAVTDRGSVVARTLGVLTGVTLESATQFSATSTDKGEIDQDPALNKTLERNQDGSIRMVGGHSVTVAETGSSEDDG
jgi:hypothetical protein